ncbi:MAG: hypothetical protein CMJ07_00745 [Pelagibacterales bacterium]|nr:hypothetical protein [Pelagibacterales bacterium]OUV28690.1 MAG: hypothetical protein CBC69_00150 [Alphaproteobacteria bacterium TMED109]|tara:strand:- start:26 stop:424 length:399 start_codon:yes stop_codon:yes gene_type:complete
MAPATLSEEISPTIEAKGSNNFEPFFPLIVFNLMSKLFIFSSSVLMELYELCARLFLLLIFWLGLRSNIKATVSGIFSLFSDTIVGLAIDRIIKHIRVALNILPGALSLKPIKITLKLNKIKIKSRLIGMKG